MISNQKLDYSNFEAATIKEDVNFENNDVKLRKNVKDAKTNGAYISYENQNSTKGNPDLKSDFCHVSVNMFINSKDIKDRLYIAPI